MSFSYIVRYTHKNTLLKILKTFEFFLDFVIFEKFEILNFCCWNFWKLSLTVRVIPNLCFSNFHKFLIFFCPPVHAVHGPGLSLATCRTWQLSTCISPQKTYIISSLGWVFCICCGPSFFLFFMVWSFLSINNIRGPTAILYYRKNKQTSSTFLHDINLFYWARKWDAIASSFLPIKTGLYHVIKYNKKCVCYFYSKMG